MELEMTAYNDWLQDYLKDAVDRKLCVKYGCTTCGAGEFREGLKRVAIQNSSVPEDAWTTLGQALGQLEPTRRNRLHKHRESFSRDVIADMRPVYGSFHWPA